MKIKRFYAQNMKQAITEISRILGPDAVILSSREREDGVEVLAAIDYDESIVTQSKQKELGTEVVKQNSNNDQHVSVQPAQKSAVWQTDPTMENMQERIKNLEGLLKDNLNYQQWKTAEIESPVKAELAKRLVDKGISSELTKQLLDDLDNPEFVEIGWQEIITSLVTELKIEEDPIHCKPGIYAFCGATGVGKTTVVAKLAARFALRHSADSVGVITMDAHRIAAKEQLAIYGKILNISIHLVENPKQLNDALHRLRNKKLVLIDTAGFSQNNPHFIKQLEDIRATAYPIKLIGVLSASGHIATQKTILNYLSKYDLSSVLITKVDECKVLGNLVSLLIEQRIPVSYLSQGQRVPEDIQQARALDLVRVACSDTAVIEKNNWEQLTDAVGVKIGETYVDKAS